MFWTTINPKLYEINVFPVDVWLHPVHEVLADISIINFICEYTTEDAV